MIHQVKKLANKARERHDEPAKAIDEIRDALWLLCDIIEKQQQEIDRLRCK